MQPNKQEFFKIFKKLQGINILVVGDVILDRFIWGKVSRISPEAPVPVVHVHKENAMLGGAGNVAHNLSVIGCNVELAGFVGFDSAGDTVFKELKSQSIGTRLIIRHESYQTPQKTRVIAHHQQVVRVDRELNLSEVKLNHDLLIQKISKNLSRFDAILFEDYGKGVISQKLMDAILPMCRKSKILTGFDPKISHIIHFHGTDISTPNLEEAKDLGRRYVNDPITLPADGNLLREALNLTNLVITLGEEGMTLFRKDKKPASFKTMAREVFDVSGAGDTVIAFLTALLAAKVPAEKATLLANAAAGVVVGKLGTATVTPQELYHYICNTET